MIRTEEGKEKQLELIGTLGLKWVEVFMARTVDNQKKNNIQHREGKNWQLNKSRN